MREHWLDLATTDGIMDTYVATPEPAANAEGKPWPVILFFMDGLGVRPTLEAMARRIAAQGYRVLLPNLYHRGGRADTLDLEQNQDRMYTLYASLTPETLRADLEALFAHVEQGGGGSTIGCVGYCLGGRIALTAAALRPEQVACAAAIHGAQLAVDHPASPHQKAGALRGKIYIAVAEEDPWLMPDETATLEAALAGAGVDYEIELYRGVAHGFAVPGLPAFNEAAAERHWSRIQRLFAETLRQP